MGYFRSHKPDGLLALGGLTAALYALLLLGLPLLLVRPQLEARALYALANSAALASAAALLCVPPAALIGYVALNSRRSLLFTLVAFSTAVPHTAVGALIFPLVRGLGLIDTAPAALLAMWVVSLPLAVATVRGAYLSLGPGLELLLRPLGLGRLPILLMYARAASKGLLLAALVAWLRAFSELGALLLVAFRPLTAGIYVYEAFLTSGLAPVIGASLLMAGMGIALSSALLLLEGWVAR